VILSYVDVDGHPCFMLLLLLLLLQRHGKGTLMLASGDMYEVCKHSWALAFRAAQQQTEAVAPPH
jgi:hypothetical protein